MSTKVDRAPIQQLKRTEPSAATAQVRTAAPVAQSSQAAAEIDLERLVKAKGLMPKGGAAVSSTAGADALWGGEQKARSDKPPLDTMQLRSLGPEARTAKIAQLQAQKAELCGKIVHRAAEVGEKWDGARLKKRTDVLHSYVATNPSVSPEVRAQVEGHLKQADDAFNALAALMAKVHAMGPKNSPTGGTPEQRAALVSQIRTLRSQESQGVQAATAALDALGLKVDVLAEAEATIDPKGAQNSQYGSLNVLVHKFYQVCFNLSVLEAFGDPVANALASSTKRMAEDDRRKDIILGQWRNQEEIKKKALDTVRAASTDLINASGMLSSSSPEQKAEGERLLGRAASKRR